MTELPSLLNPGGRWLHACGSTGPLLIVSGGWGGGCLSSTEVYDYSQGTQGSWRQVGELPTPRTGLRGGNLGGQFHVSGGYDYKGSNQIFDSVLRWDPPTESWVEVGKMQEARYDHAVIEVSLADVFC